MALATGTKLGPYEIQSPLGAGGMGEVYRARDAKLGRDVALKVLPEALTQFAERVARLRREAQVLASLNHPNIATIYGFEDSGTVRALVMELVDGPTLAELIKQGAIPVDEALPLAKQICEAVEYAHERGIVHRDLKPSNVKVTPGGNVKVLDFGLAKALESDAAATDISSSPTLSAAATRAGFLMGTAAYMSPEQARGKNADRRSDIWAFGVVLFEILSGKRLFTGETASDTLAEVLKMEPEWGALPANTPARLRELLARCLKKDPRQRLQSIGDARIALEEISSGTPEAGSVLAGVNARVAIREGIALPWVLVALLVIVSVLAIWRPWQSGPKPARTMRFSADLGADARLYTGFGASTILSPDGTRLAFVATGPDEKRRAYVRSLDQLQATPLFGTENASDLFFSPDGQWLGFFAEGRLKKISVQGGASVSICDARADFGASWAENDTIVFADNLRTPLSQVPSAGGKAQNLLTLDQPAQEVTQRWPQVLPGDGAVLFTSDTHNGDYEDADIVVYSITSGHRKVLQRGGFFGRYVRSGHLLFMHQGTLFAVPFDLKKLEVTGQPTPILEGIVATPFDGHAQFSVSDRGDLVYITGHGGFQAVSLYWMDRENQFTALRSAPGVYRYPAFSPDGKRLALQVYDGRREDIWVYEWERDTLTRLTFGSGEDYDAPIWTPDGQRITYSGVDHQGVGGADIYWKRADGSGDAQRLTETKKPKFPDSWSPDGRTLVFDQMTGPARGTHPESLSESWDILTMTMEGSEKLGWKPGEPKPLLSAPFSQELAALSPDGRWLAYTSHESGGYEVYVRPFPGPGGKWQISTGGGSLPKWSRVSKELFFRTENNRIMVVAYTESGGSFRPEKTQFWSPGQFTDLGGSINDFDLHPDGKRLVVLKTPPTSDLQPSNRMTFIFDFFDELRRKAPSTKN